MGQKRYLKWLFKVQFADDSTYMQTPDDQSVLDEKRSEFYDMLEAEKRGKKIRYFSLINRETKDTVTVDLGTGLFFVNSMAVLLESEKLPILPEKFTLIFYRQWTENINVTVNNKDKKIVKTEPQNNAICEYFIGWECEIAGKKYIQKLAVS